jgi:DNA-directed RNA polymerase subunit RPC12/RpoP
VTIVCPHCGKPIVVNLKPERVRLPSDWRERVQEREKGNSE